MANTRELVKRRKAIRNIRKITRTMELIATAQFRKALDRAVQAEAYTRKIAELAADLSANAGEIKHPLLTPHAEVKNAVLLVLCSNRGLCGGYNAAVLRAANERIRQYAAEGINLHLEASGKRAIIYFRFQRVPTEHTYTHLQDKPNFDEVEKIANRYIADYGAGRVDRVDVAYMKFLSASRQTPVVETLLPLTSISTDPGVPKGRRFFYVEVQPPGVQGEASEYFSTIGELIAGVKSDLTEMDYEADLHEEKLGFLVRVRRVPGGLVFGKWENHEIEDEYWRIKKDQVQYEFIPDAKGILEEILPVSFKVRLFKCLLDAAVSEQIARRVAMKAATENADEIIKAITQEYNRARQAKITKELAEIIGGAAALE